MNVTLHKGSLMQAVILAGGFGTRLSEETSRVPKPMVEIGDRPILWHIMKLYSTYGINDFIICCGYKSYTIKEYFVNYHNHTADFQVDLRTAKIETLSNYSEPWKVTLIDTGMETQTGGRLKRVAHLINRTFCMTYGDGLADVNIGELVDFHQSHKCLATMTAVTPPGRFGSLKIDGNEVKEFTEKPDGDGGAINGGFFVLEPEALDYIDGDQTYWEHEPLRNLASQGQLQAFVHKGFWKPMDTLRDRTSLNEMWASGNAPWKSW